ncbi:MAG: Zeta toxin family protein [Armatimonadetes bacterium]|nr:Zeta toxin family protein [Armatimonadota bacterium]
MKQCIIIAGPNGAGKTTFATEFLPKEADTANFFNADLIAFGLSPLAPERAAIEASKIMLARVEDCCRRGESFGLESTLSGRAHLKLIREWQGQGYSVVLHFLRLASADLAVDRVRLRVAQGGHWVPGDVIRRRYTRGLANLPLYQQVVDEWKLWDTSQGKPELIDER